VFSNAAVARKFAAATAFESNDDSKMIAPFARQMVRSEVIAFRRSFRYSSPAGCPHVQVFTFVKTGGES
jgi:hypothetical protein